jgi:hypothetical protein
VVYRVIECKSGAATAEGRVAGAEKGRVLYVFDGYFLGDEAIIILPHGCAKIGDLDLVGPYGSVHWIIEVDRFLEEIDGVVFSQMGGCIRFV